MVDQILFHLLGRFESKERFVRGHFLEDDFLGWKMFQAKQQAAKKSKKLDQHINVLAGQKPPANKYSNANIVCFFNLNTRLAGPTWAHHEHPGQRRYFGPCKVQHGGRMLLPNLVVAVTIRGRFVIDQDIIVLLVEIAAVIVFVHLQLSCLSVSSYQPARRQSQNGAIVPVKASVRTCMVLKPVLQNLQKTIPPFVYAKMSYVLLRNAW
jgi:hypothetical protein